MDALAALLPPLVVAAAFLGVAWAAIRHTDGSVRRGRSEADPDDADDPDDGDDPVDADDADDPDHPRDPQGPGPAGPGAPPGGRR
jgi:hypothetical protein